MTAPEESNAPNAVDLTDEDVAFLMTQLRDPARAQPLTTQELIDALRNRASR